MDLQVALRVMGHCRRRANTLVKHSDHEAEQISHAEYCWDYFDQHGNVVRLLRYTKDVAADYEVLERVREWTAPQRFSFGCELDAVWSVREHGENGDRYVPENAVQYRPGDYSRAALAVLGNGGAK